MSKVLVRSVAGLLRQEPFTDCTLWNGVDAFALEDAPGLVQFGYTPIDTLTRTIGGADAGGVRESHLYVESDGTWHLFYGAGDGTNGAGGPWRIQRASSTNRGRTWTKHGPINVGLSNGRGGTFAASDMLWVGKFGSTYYLHVYHPQTTISSSHGPVDSAPTMSSIWTATAIDGTWTFFGPGVTCGVQGATPYDNWHYAGCTVKAPNGDYLVFGSTSQVSPYFLSTSILRSRTGPGGPFAVITGDMRPSSHAHYGENPKVFWHQGLHRWVELHNGATTVAHTDTHHQFISEDLLTWPDVEGVQSAGPYLIDGNNAGGIVVGLPSPFYVAEGLAFIDANGYVPFTYDGFPESWDGTTAVEQHVQRKIVYCVYEPSASCLRFTAANGTVNDFTDAFTRSDRSINGDNGWTQSIGTGCAIVSNDLDMQSVSADRVVVQAGSLQDGTIETDVELGHDCSVGHVFRYADASNFYFIDYRADTDEQAAAITLWKKVAGSYSSIATITLGLPVGPALLKTVFSGTSIKAYLNGTLVASWTDSTFSASGKYGLRNGGAGTGNRLVHSFSARHADSTAVIQSSAQALSHSDFYAEFVVEFVTTTAAGFAAFDFRQDGSGNGYRLKVNYAGGLVLQKGASGTYSNAGSSSGSQVTTVAQHHRVQLSAIGGVITAKLDGETQVSYTDGSPISSGTQFGFVGCKTDFRLRTHHMRSGNTITVQGLVNAQQICLRAPGGVPIISTTVSGTSHAFMHTHFPMGMIELDGVDHEHSSGLLWGGDTVVLTHAISVTLRNHLDVLQPGLSNLTVAWFDESTPDNFTVPKQQWTGQSTDGSALLSVARVSTALTTGQTGFILVTASDGSKVGGAQVTL
jgi:hypothetical protein